MFDNSVAFFKVPGNARDAFEQNAQLPDSVARHEMLLQSQQSPASCIELVLDQRTWIALAGVAGWVARRISVPLDEFTKTIASEAAKSAYSALGDLLRWFKSENSEAADLAARLERGRAAAELALGAGVDLELGLSVAPNQSVRLVRGLDAAEADSLGFFMMMEPVAKAAERILSDGLDVLGDLAVRVQPYGFSLYWTEMESGQRQQAFLPNGTELSPPMAVPAPSFGEIQALRAQEIARLPPELRDAAAKALEKADIASGRRTYDDHPSNERRGP